MTMIETNARPNVHDTVFVEAEVGDRPVRFRAVVVNIMPGCLWLGLIKPDPKLAQVRGGDPVILTFRRRGTGMVAAEEFLGHLGTTRSRLFSVRWSDECRLVQRRDHLRVNARCPVEYRIVESEVAEPGTAGRGVTRNISAGGVQFRVDRPAEDTIAVGDLLELRLDLGGGTVLADATVVRVEDATDIGPDDRPLPPSKATHAPVTAIAVRFESISEKAQDRIVHYIFTLQRLQKASRL